MVAQLVGKAHGRCWSRRRSSGPTTGQSWASARITLLRAASEPAAHHSNRGAPAGVDARACASLQPLGTTGAHADLGVVPEADQILLGERRRVAPAGRALPKNPLQDGHFGASIPATAVTRERSGLGVG